MVHLDLSEEECAVLRELVALRALELKHEIHHTDNRDFRARLRREDAVLQQLGERLGLVEPAAAR